LAETIYDVAVIGGGPAGYTASIRAGQYGLKTALIEKDSRLGGTCLLVGCIPTKALLFNAEIYDHFKHAKDYGLDGLGEANVNWKTILDRKNAIVSKHVKGLEFLMRKNKVTVVPGFARLTGPAANGVHSVEVAPAGDPKGKPTTVKAKNIILATGSDARLLPGFNISDKVLTNVEILSLDRIPKSLLVIGAGAVGVEFGSIFRSFGSEISILEYLPRLVPVEDEDISKELARSFRKRGIESATGAKVESVEETKDGVKVTYTGSDGKPAFKEAEKVLVAVGRGPRTEGIGLEKTKIKSDRGFIQVNEYMQTDEPGIYAIGDIVAGMPQLAHSGSMSGLVAVAKIAGKYARPVRRDHPRLHLHRTADRQRRPHRSPRQRAGTHRQGRQVPLCRKLQSHHRRFTRRLREGRRRRQVRRDPRRAHHRPAGNGAHRRSRDGARTRSHGRRPDVDDPRSPDTGRSHARRLQQRGRAGDQRLDQQDPGAQVRIFGPGLSFTYAQRIHSGH